MACGISALTTTLPNVIRVTKMKLFNLQDRNGNWKKKKKKGDFKWNIQFVCQ
jgi:hypothetical protein